MLALIFPFIAFLKIEQLMAWPIPDIPDMFSPVRHKWNRPLIWLLALLLPYLLWLPVLGLMWYRTTVETVFALILLPLPLLVWSGVLLIVFIRSMHRELAAKTWLQEKQNIHQRWVNWAQRGVAVIDSASLLPEALDPSLGTTVLGQSLVFKRNEASFYPSAKIRQFYQQQLNSLLTRTKVKKLTIHIAEPDGDEYQEWAELFETALADLGLADTVEIELSKLFFDLSLLESWLENYPSGLHVFVSTAFNDEPQAAEFTENAVWVVLAAPDEVQSKHLPLKALIHRPIDLLLSDEASAQASLQQFEEYGLPDKKINALWPAGLTQEATNALNASLADSGILLQQKGLVLHTPNQYIGELPPNAAWLVLAMALEADNQDAFLLAWEKEPHICLMAYVQMADTAVGNK